MRLAVLRTAAAVLAVLLLVSCARDGDAELAGEQVEDGLADHILVLEEEMSNLRDELRRTQADLRTLEDDLDDAEEARDEAEEARVEAEQALQDALEEEQPPGTPTSPATDDVPRERPAGPGTAAGLSEQLHLWVAEALGEDVAVTGGWQAQQVPDGYRSADGASFATPGAVVFALAADRYGATLGEDWEVTSRVLREQDDTAVAAILAWGLADAAVVGYDTRVTLRRDAAGWHVRAIEQRPHCRDAYDPELQACV